MATYNVRTLKWFHTVFTNFDFNNVFDNNEENFNELSSASKNLSIVSNYMLDRHFNDFISKYGSKEELLNLLECAFERGYLNKNEMNVKFIEAIPNVEDFNDYYFYFKKIYVSQFHLFEKLKFITLPEKVQEIPSSIFYGCKNLEEVKFENQKEGSCQITFPSYLKHIGINSFYGCKKIKKIKFENNLLLDTIREYAFSHCDLGSLDLTPLNRLKNIFSGAFRKNRLKDVKFPSSLNNICKCCFEENDLQSLDLSNTSITVIPDKSFRDNPNLSKVKFPKTLKTITEKAFLNTNLKKVDIPKDCFLNGEFIFPEGCVVNRI